VRTLGVWTTPLADCSSPLSTLPSKSVNRPLIDFIIASVSTTSKRMLECTGSTAHVPAGIRVCDSVWTAAILGSFRASC
jgi:hypothetical protein